MTDHPRFKNLSCSNDAAHRQYHGGRLVELVLWAVDRLRQPHPPAGTASPASTGQLPSNHHEFSSEHTGHADEESDLSVSRSRRHVATEIGSRVLAFLGLVALGLVALIATDRRRSERPLLTAPATGSKEVAP